MILYEKGDMVSFKLSEDLKETYSGIVIARWKAYHYRYVYQISSMNHGMCTFSVGQSCVLKKLG